MTSVPNGAWPRIRDVGAFLIGAFMLVEQTVQEVSFGVAANPVIIGAGLAAWGITASGAASRYVKKKLNDEP